MHATVFLAVFRVTPVDTTIFEPIGSNVTLNCSTSEGGNVGWSIQLPGEPEARLSSSGDPLPPSIVPVHESGFSLLFITGTLEISGSILKCRTFVGSSLRLSGPISVTFYGELTKISSFGYGKEILCTQTFASHRPLISCMRSGSMSMHDIPILTT